MDEENEKQKFLIVDGYALERASLKAILTAGIPTDHVAEASTVEEVEEQLSQHEFSMLIFSLVTTKTQDMRMLEEVAALSIKNKILVMGPGEHLNDVVHVIRLGVKGYITKKHGHEELIRAVKQIISGEKYFPEPTHREIDEKALVEVSPVFPHISVREKQILDLVVQGYSNVAIAEQLYISTRTVENHRANMMRKLGVKNAAELVKKAIEEHIV
ncbi:MAG: response regulator transcription factor [Cyclobacteriaceae bacterium]